MIQIKGEFMFAELKHAGLFDLDKVDSENSKMIQVWWRKWYEIFTGKHYDIILIANQNSTGYKSWLFCTKL